MTDDDLKVMVSAKTMTEIVAANDDIFKNNAKANELKNALDADIGVLESAGASSVSARGLRLNATAEKTAAETALDKFLRKFASTGKAIKKSEPEFDNTFVMRRGNYGVQELLDAARAFMDDLTPAKIAKVAEFGFKSGTPANLQTKIDAIEAQRTKQNTGKGGVIAATAETKAAIKRIRANRLTLKEIGENLIEEDGNAGLLAEWKSASKIEKRKTTPPTTPTTPPTP